MKIRRELLKRMIEHAIREAPLECCGFLAGAGDEVEEVHEASNERRSPVAFSVPPEEIFECFRDLRRRGKLLLGIYHSHPEGEAIPSARDAAEFHYPGISYWIVSLKGAEPSVGCFEWKDDHFEAAPWELFPEDAA